MKGAVSAHFFDIGSMIKQPLVLHCCSVLSALASSIRGVRKGLAATKKEQIPPCGHTQKRGHRADQQAAPAIVLSRHRLDCSTAHNRIQASQKGIFQNHKAAPSGRGRQ